MEVQTLDDEKGNRFFKVGIMRERGHYEEEATATHKKPIVQLKRKGILQLRKVELI